MIIERHYTLKCRNDKETDEKGFDLKGDGGLEKLLDRQRTPGSKLSITPEIHEAIKKRLELFKTEYAGYRLHFQDETRIGLMTKCGRKLTP
jgi:hypothetical protein